MDLIRPFSLAWERMEAQLFRPFSMEKWFALGFTAWLSTFVIGRSNDLLTWLPYDLESFRPTEELGMTFWLIGVPLIVVGIVVVLGVFAWIGCRGQFMFLDNVVRGRQDVSAPWKRYAKEANSLFLIYLAVMAALLGLFLVVYEAVLLMVAPVFVAESSLTMRDHLPAVVGIFLFAMVWLGVALAVFYLREFGVLWMYRNGGTAWAAMKVVGRQALRLPAEFILYLGIRIVMDILLGIVCLALACVLCIGCIPYISTVVVLPVLVFRTHYAIECFRQLGAQFDVRLGGLVPPPLPAAL